MAAGYHGFDSGQSLVLGIASVTPTEGGSGCVSESLKALELIPLAHRVMVDQALAAAEKRVVHAVWQREEIFGAQFACLADGAKSRRIRLADRVMEKRVLVQRQTRVARRPSIRETRRSSSPSTSATAGPPTMAAATRKSCPRWADVSSQYSNSLF